MLPLLIFLMRYFHYLGELNPKIDSGGFHVKLIRVEIERLRFVNYARNLSIILEGL